MSKNVPAKHTPSDRDIVVMRALETFHQDEERSGFFYAAALALIETLDALYGIDGTPLPDVSSESNG